MRSFLPQNHLSLILILLSFALKGNLIQAQTFQWANTHGAQGKDYGMDLTRDNQQNIYLTGSFNETVDFDPGSGVALKTWVGGDDVYVQKLDPNGNLIWVITFGSSQNDFGQKLIIDGQGNVFVFGGFKGTCDFDPGVGVTNKSSNGEYDIFIAKYDSNGNFLWVKTMGGPSRDLPLDAVIDNAGNIYTGGYFYNSVDFDPGSGTFNLTAFSSDWEDGFVQKLDKDGNFIWAYGFGADRYDAVNAIGVDQSGNILVSGVFRGTVDFDPQSTTSSLVSGHQDIFIQKIDADANLLWVEKIGVTGVSENLTAMNLDSFENIILAGTFGLTTDLDPGENVFNVTSNGFGDFFVLKLNSTGEFIWGHSTGGDADESVSDLKVDANGSIYATGLFSGSSVDFDPSSQFKILYPGLTDIFLVKYSADGKYILAQGFGSNNDYDEGLDLEVDSAKNVIITGYFSGTTDFDPSSNTANKTSGGLNDIFLVKWSTCAASTSSNISTSTCGTYVSPSGKYTYTQSGVYKDTIANSVGCDSIITINLTVTNETTSTISPKSCNGTYTSPSGLVFTTSGVYKDTIPNAGGCDSVITINLTINTQTEASITETACNAYTSPSGIEYTSTGVYKDTIPNAAGCDSVITINLTINTQTEASITETACNSYTSPSGIEYTSTGVYKDTIPNAAGCDSVITINLTINTVDATVTNLSNTLIANQAGAQYQWLDCNQAFSPIPNETNQNYTPTANGSYAVDVTYNNCTERSACQAVTNIGIGEVIISNNLSIYPNPVTDWLTIKAEKSAINARLFITDNLGRVVIEGKLSNTLTQFNLQQLAPGVYNLLVKQNDETPVLMQGIIKK